MTVVPRAPAKFVYPVPVAVTTKEGFLIIYILPVKLPTAGNEIVEAPVIIIVWCDSLRFA